MTFVIDKSANLLASGDADVHPTLLDGAVQDVPRRFYSTKYRPDIDGLCCLAVLLVVFYHVFPRQVRGGFIGVDIFFVISGYLITSIILRELHYGAFRLSHFYARRIRRIFPALAVVLVASFAAGWFILAPKDYAALGANIAGGAGFASNFVLLQQTGYF